MGSIRMFPPSGQLLLVFVFVFAGVLAESGDGDIPEIEDECQVATANSTGIQEYIFKIRELVFPDKNKQPCDTTSSCEALQCCNTTTTLSTSGRPASSKQDGKCVLYDWVIPSGLGLVAAFLVTILVCCCCCCCCRSKKAEYDMGNKA